MAVLGLSRFSTGPVGTGEMLIRHAAPATAAEDAFPGLIERQLAQAGDQWRDPWVTLGLTRRRAGGVACAPASRRPEPHSPLSKGSGRLRGGHRCVIARGEGPRCCCLALSPFHPDLE